MTRPDPTRPDPKTGFQLYRRILVVVNSAKKPRESGSLGKQVRGFSRAKRVFNIGPVESSRVRPEGIQNITVRVGSGQEGIEI